jgi:hypothetical protein
MNTAQSILFKALAGSFSNQENSRKADGLPRQSVYGKRIASRRGEAMRRWGLIQLRRISPVACFFGWS